MLVKQKKDEAVISVTDHAIGIPAESLFSVSEMLNRVKAECRFAATIVKGHLQSTVLSQAPWMPHKQRPTSIYQPRNRRSCVGELIQIDRSNHRWFEDRAPACTLPAYIDDATSRMMYLHFTYSESTFSYFEATRAYLDRYGQHGRNAFPDKDA